MVSLGVDSASLNPAIALSTMQGRLTLPVVAILAEIERHLIAPRVTAGLAAFTHPCSCPVRSGGRGRSVGADG